MPMLRVTAASLAYMWGTIQDSRQRKKRWKSFYLEMQGFCTEKSWSSPNSCSSPNSWTPAVSVHPSCSIMQGCHCIFFPVSILLAQQVFDKLLVLSVLFSDFVALACPYLTRLLCACVWEELKPALRHYYTHTHAPPRPPTQISRCIFDLYSQDLCYWTSVLVKSS